MSYKLQSNVFFKKVSDDQVNILLSDDDNYIFKLNKVAAKVFIMLIEKNLSPAKVQEEVISLTGKPESEVNAFLEQFYQQMTEHKFLVKI